MNYEPEVTEATEEAEDALLGSIFIESCRGNDKAIREVAKILEPWDFRGCLKSDKPDRWVWRARIYYAMTLCKLSPHEINVAHKMIELGILQDTDCVMMAHCGTRTPSSLNYMQYAKVVKDYSIKRQAIELAAKGDIQGLFKLSQHIGYKGLDIEKSSN